MEINPIESSNKKVQKLLNNYMDIEYRAVINILYENRFNMKILEYYQSFQTNELHDKS